MLDVFVAPSQFPAPDDMDKVLQLWIFGCRTGPSFPFAGILSTDFKVLQALSRPSSWFTGMLTMLGRKLQCFYVSC
ncbi:hypothetical protein CY35_11G056100 [Sphagnum magellanicum]|nr:hypothetical protein CY35_11G056100 [Sphagnum magellanicum]